MADTKPTTKRNRSSLGMPHWGWGSLVTVALAGGYAICTTNIKLTDHQHSRSMKPTIPQTKFYLLHGPRLWGDYGDVLIQGFGGESKEHQGFFEIERTGPFVPPITFPTPGSRNLVVTDEFRKQLESGDLGQMRFRPVIKARIVDLPWQDWNLDANEAQEVPETGVPDDYLDRPHSPEIAEAIGDLWQVILNDGAEIDIDIKRAPWDYDVRVHVDTWNGAPIFFGKHPKADVDRGRWIIVTGRGKRWLEEKAGKWVGFKELPVK